MLMPIDTDRKITRVPHPDEFYTLRKRLGQDRFDEIVEHIDGLIDKAGGEIVTSSWLPDANDWRGTPLQFIYDIAAKKDYDLAGKMFGLIVWHTVMHRPDRWRFYRPEGDGTRIMGMTYFQPR